MAIECIIFDFDGVVADSETSANAVLAAYATELGLPLTTGDSLAIFGGRRAADTAAELERRLGRAVPGFPAELERRTLAAFADGLREVDGVSGFLARTRGLARCIASSSSHARLRFCLRRLGLEDELGGIVINGDDVARGKPAPDIFLRALERTATAADRAIVIEDSPGGVRAAVAAGIRVIGLLAAGHLGPDHGDRLRDAGATFLARDYDAVRALIEGPIP